MKSPWFLIALAWLPVVALAQTPTAKSPPDGIEIPAPARAALREKLEKLEGDFRALVGSGKLAPALQARIPDVEIFPIAVRRVLDWNHFYDVKQVGMAEDLLKEGRERLEALAAGDTPWTKATGPVVRGFRSRIDGSVQPYGIVVPEGKPTAPVRLDVWLHGRSDKLTELAFVRERMRSRGEFTPEGAYVLHPYGRFCNAFKFAGETDVLEALEDALTQYSVDRRHIAIRGFSMGGAGTWHLAGHHTSKWAVANPGAGFAETAGYAKVFAPNKPVPPWWEQVLWRLYDVPGYVENLGNRPVIAYSGEVDAQKAAADLMVSAAAAKGIPIPHLIGPGTGHRYHPETKKEVAALVDAAAKAGSPEAPERVVLATYTLRYNRMDWVEILGLERHWEEARVEARKSGPRTISVETRGVTALALHLPGAWSGAGAWKVVCDGRELSVPGPRVELRKGPGGWEAGGLPAQALWKRHGLQGPVDDAFMDAFVFVQPTGKPFHAAIGDWTRKEMERAIAQWRLVFRGEIRVVKDTEVTPELMASHHLVLWGDPSSNGLLGKLLSQASGGAHALPLKWDAKEVRLGATGYSAAGHLPVMIYPNPMAPSRYLVLNSTFTFRQGSDTTNALQTPKLPDWAVVDISQPPGDLAPGAIPDAGFFDEQWRLP
ncbi:MAG: hypothetical protein RLZZ244_2591 [Verrucomicrobiota bacterium]|jgi:dienelactone hydrolase